MGVYTDARLRDTINETFTAIAALRVEIAEIKETLLYTNKTLREIKEAVKKGK
jgi:hypothetical protein